jgi:hypothetical protein
MLCFFFVVRQRRGSEKMNVDWTGDNFLDAEAKRKRDEESGPVYLRVDALVQRERTGPFTGGFNPVPPTRVSYVVGPIKVLDGAEGRVDEFIARLNSDDEDEDDDDDDEEEEDLAWEEFDQEARQLSPVFSATDFVEVKYSIATQDDLRTLVVTIPEENAPEPEETESFLFLSATEPGNGQKTILTAITLLMDKGTPKEVANYVYMSDISNRLRASGVKVSKNPFTRYKLTKSYKLSEVTEYDKGELGMWAAALDVIKGGLYRQFYYSAQSLSILVDGTTGSLITPADDSDDE